MTNFYSNFTNCYSVSKTLRFSLIPQYETSENIRKNGILLADKEKSINYEKIKPILDKCHIKYIDTCLSQYNDDWVELYETLLLVQKDKTQKSSLEAVQKKYRKRISTYLKKESKQLNPKDLIDGAIAGKYYVPEMKDNIDLFHSFNKFSTYFINYQTARDNMYEEDGSTAIAYRVVNEIFPQFVSNMKQFKELPESVVNQIEKDVSILLGSYSLNEIFEIEFFNNVLSQKGIDFYNSILGGITAEDGVTKQKGINECCNICFQKELLNKKVVFKLLYKQILSDKETLSFIADKFDSDEELSNALQSYVSMVTDTLKQHRNSLGESFNSQNVSNDKIYVNKKMIPFLSMISYDNDWHRIRDKLKDNKIKEKDEYTLKELQLGNDIDLLSKAFERITLSLENLEICKKELKFQSKITSYVEIKNYMDAIQELEKLFKIFATTDENEKDSSFYGVFDEVYRALRENIHLYNMIRNYATKAPYSTEKYKLTFNCSSFMNVWAQDYDTNGALIIYKDNKYYLLVVKKKLSDEEKANLLKLSNNVAIRYVYESQKADVKNISRIFIYSKTAKREGEENVVAPAVKKYDLPIEQIEEIYKNKSYTTGYRKKNEIEYKKALIKMIDYYKLGLSKHESFGKFVFSWKESAQYNDINEFIDDVTKCCYRLSEENISFDYLQQLVKEDKVYLFQIYNKDFSEKSTGNPNLHTLYWKELFTEENLNSPIFKLNGEAEIFFRPSSIENPFIHKKDSVLVRKKDKNGVTVEEIYRLAIEDIAKGKAIYELESKYPNLVFRTSPHDIVKDKRYSQDRFTFHVPITMNNAIDEKYKKFNEAVLRHIESTKDFHIIGIDRGERNLIYISCIDKNGNIVYQKSFNSIAETDYQGKLVSLEKLRLDERRSWEAVTKIKDVKAGYLSQVVHEIVKLMMKYPSIIVMEDLNIGFKQGRIRIERQVYQNFEKALIEKLNYCVLKDKASSQAGGVRHAYQLSAKFDGFEKLGKQSGFIFYVPARNTSKIDYQTGFVNLFTSAQLKYESINKSKELFSLFDDISYDKLDCFRFDFKYSNFKLKQSDYKDQWSVYTIGEKRIAHTKIDGYDTTKEIDVTKEMKQLFLSYGIDYKSNLKQQIVEMEDKSFFKTLIWLLSVTLQLRYENADNDFILSPVQKNGKFFDSRKALENEPLDGDANGAYHIALKGLQMVKNNICDGKIFADEKGKQFYNWLKFAQEQEYKK